MADRVANADVTITQWKRQKRIYDARRGTIVDLAFATFFLNRTNRSGILDARPIGGFDQTGNWLVDARFNRKELAARIRLLGRYRNRVTVHRYDGITFLRKHIARFAADSFYYVDPPYLTHGADLYLDTLTWKDHQELAALLTKNRARWILTYDCDARVPKSLYPHNRCVPFTIAHTAATQHLGAEYAVFSHALDVSVAELKTLSGPHGD